MNPPEAADRFVWGEKLGSGSFSVVRLATHFVTKKKVAMKCLSKERIAELGTEERVWRETHHLRLCAAHPHIVRLYDVVEAPTEKVLVMEFVSGGELHEYMAIKKDHKVTADEARCFFQQIVSAVQYMHHKRVVHRDLKLENILLDDDRVNVKIADFGLSNLVRDGELMRTPCGSPHYAAPEIISGRPYEGPGVDVWSCGVILYGLLCGTLPFRDECVSDQFEKIRRGAYHLPAQLTKDSKNLIRGMLEVDTEKRTTIAAVRLHPWFNRKLPPYLRQSPERMEIGERTLLDPEVVDEVLSLYDTSTHLSQKRPLSRKAVEKAAAFKGDDDDDDDENTRDLRCTYELLLHEKHERQHSKELAEVKRFTNCGFCTSFSD